MPRIRQRLRSPSHIGAIALLALITLAGLQPALAQVCPFDDGNSSLEVEGLILTRYALGVTGAPLVASTGINAVDAPSVAATINCPSCGLNITGNATMTVADATIISRKLAGFTGTALTDGLALGSGTRNTAAAVQSFLLAGCGATGGTVTSIATGPGLTGGTITTTGTINLASTQLLPTTACSTDQIAKWNGSAWVCVAPSAALVPPSCAAGQVLELGSGGAVQCRTPPLVYTNLGTITTTAANRAVSVAIQPSGALPVVSFYNGDLNVVACGNASCSGSRRTSVPVNGTGAGQYPSSASSVDRTMISHHDVTNGDLRFMSCAPSVIPCGGFSFNTLDSFGIVGTFSSIAIGADGFAVISYHDQTNGALKVAKCGNITCTSGNVFTTIDNTGTAGLDTSIAIPADGLPVISYRDTSFNLKVAKCIAANCVGGASINIITTSVRGATLALGADGLPIITFGTSPATGLKVLKCGNAACSAGNTLTIADSSASAYGTAIAVGSDGLPVVFYAGDVSGNLLKLLKCGNVACNSGNTSSVIDRSASFVGLSVVVPADGLPLLVYIANSEVVAAKCTTAACLVP
jgi:hypothetical protein